MKNKYHSKLAIIGLGMVGTAIGHLLKKAGHEIIAICDKNPAALKRALPYTGGITFRDPQKAVIQADYILLTTSDDAISSACREISASALIKNKLVFHMSGAGGLDLLEAAKKAGALIASIHPLQSFSSIDTAVQNIPGSVFGITADKSALKKATMIVHDLNGIPIVISNAQKPLYHAAACFASNYLVSLLNVVEAIYLSTGIDKITAQKAYLPLVYGTLKNIEKSGSIQALTGPIARGDIGTIEKHISSISSTIPQFSSLYSILGLVATDIAREKGALSTGQAKIINDLLKGAINNEYTK